MLRPVPLSSEQAAPRTGSQVRVTSPEETVLAFQVGVIWALMTRVATVARRLAGLTGLVVRVEIGLEVPCRPSGYSAVTRYSTGTSGSSLVSVKVSSVALPTGAHCPLPAGRLR